MGRPAIWPLFRPSHWRTTTAGLDLAPGFALVDLSMRRVDHRRLAAQVCSLWLIAIAWNAIYGIYPLTLAMGVINEFEMSALTFLFVLAAGVNAPGAIALLTVWQVVSLILPPYIFNIHGMRAFPMQPILIATSIAAFGFGGFWTDALYQYRSFPFMLLETCFAFPIIMFILLLPLMRDLSAWVSARIRS